MYLVGYLTIKSEHRGKSNTISSVASTAVMGAICHSKLLSWLPLKLELCSKFSAFQLPLTLPVDVERKVCGADKETRERGRANRTKWGESAVTATNMMMGMWLTRKGPSGRSQSCVWVNVCEAEIAPVGRKASMDMKASRTIF